GVEPEAGPDPSLPGLEWAGLHADLQPLARRLASPQTLLRQLLAPSPEQMERQRAILGVLHGASAGAPAALAELCARLAAHPRRASHGRRMPSLVRRPRPERADPSRPRVVNMVYCEGSPVGGVRTWAARLAEAFAAEDLGYDVRTLLV